jgi:general secretion pathway protein E
LSGVLQVPVNEKTGLTFGKGLRAVLRHDPDVILVGEIRDAETAQIAVQAAMTGHLVFSTVHANSAIDVVGRLTHMGIDHYNLASALNGVVAQRLLRKVCLRCRQSRSPSDDEKRKFPELETQHELIFGLGCGECRGTGYRGRIACAEVMEVNDDLRDGIIQRVSPRKLALAAQATGMLRISAQALQLLVAGTISLEEYGRVAEFN